VSLLVFAREIWWMDQQWTELRWGHTIDHKVAAVLGTLCMIPPRNSNPWDFWHFLVRESV
jgi:hypothetical protein